MKEEIWFYAHRRCNLGRFFLLVSFREQPQPSLLAAEHPAALCRDSTRWCRHTKAATRALCRGSIPRQHPLAASPGSIPRQHPRSQRLHCKAKERGRRDSGSPVPQQAAPGERSPSLGALQSTQKHHVPRLAGAGIPGKIRLERMFCVPRRAPALPGESRELRSRWQRNLRAAETPARPCTPCSSCAREVQGQGEAIV